MRKIKIIRKKEDFNKNVSYKIFVDHQQVTRLAYGEEKTLEFKNEAQFLVAKVESGSSKKLALDKLGARQKIEISGSRFKNKYLKFAGALIPLLGLPLILNINYDRIRIVGGILFAMYLLFIIYMLIFERRKWLKLKVIN